MKKDKRDLRYYSKNGEMVMTKKARALIDTMSDEADLLLCEIIKDIPKSYEYLSDDYIDYVLQTLAIRDHTYEVIELGTLFVALRDIDLDRPELFYTVPPVQTEKEPSQDRFIPTYLDDSRFLNRYDDAIRDMDTSLREATDYDYHIVNIFLQNRLIHGFFDTLYTHCKKYGNQPQNLRNAIRRVSADLLKNASEPSEMVKNRENTLEVDCPWYDARG